MATQHIKSLILDKSVYEIVPHRLTDGTYFVNLPTLTKDEILVTETILTNKNYAYQYQLYDSYLKFGGKNISGTVSPVDMAINELFSANRFAFLPGKHIQVEYSKDGGATWQDYQASDEYKTQLVTDTVSLTIGKVGNAKATIQDQLRITITAANGVLYTSLKKMHVRVSTSGASGSRVKLETRTVARYNANEDIWAEISETPVSGWSGWNVLNHSITFGGGITQTGNIRQIRFTFSISGVSEKYNSNLSVLSIYGYGENAWSISNTFAEKGHIYDFNMKQEVFFPALIQASKFKVKDKDDTFLILAGGGTKLISDFILKKGTNKDFILGDGSNKAMSTFSTATWITTEDPNIHTPAEEKDKIYILSMDFNLE